MLVVLVCVFGVLGQTTPGNLPNQSLLVSIPVSVTNQNGQQVAGLNTASFSLSENYQNRALESAQEVAAVTFGKMNDKVLFLVLDAISMMGEVVPAETRKECLQLLASATTNGVRTSLLELDTDGLHVIHEVSTPSSILASALLQLDGEKRFLTNTDQLQGMRTDDDKPLVTAEADRLKHFGIGSVEGLRGGASNVFLRQLKAFQDLAGALRHAQGRKTVLWLTGYFPLDVTAREDGISLYGHDPGFALIPESIDYQRTVNLLNDAHISVFPIQLQPVHARQEYQTKLGLDQFAQSTGGSVLVFDTPEKLLKHAEDLTTSYYLLAFHPETIATGVRWKKLKVHLNDQSLRVTSPNGLYVIAPTK
jgi:VWFA-related protein